MNDQIKEILEALDNSDKDLQDVKRYSLILTMKQQKVLLDYITNLQDKVENQRQELVSLNDRLKEVKKSNGFLKQKVKQYENPDDMTLFYMWLDVKAKDKIKQLKQENERLKNGYCELKVKCNNGECDCTNEEYEDMAQANMRGSLLLEDYKSKCEKLELENKVLKEQMVAMVQPNYVYGIELQGVDKE